MLNIDLTFVLTAVNLIVLYLFLRKFLFGRVTKFMDDRAAAIDADMQKGAADKAEGERFREEYEGLVKSASTERNRIMEAARHKANAHYDDMVAKAKAEASRIVAAATTDAEREKEKAMAEMRSEVTSLALMAASKVMQANMDNQKNRQMVEDILDGIGDNGGVA